MSKSLCKNKVSDQAELFEIIKFYYGEYKSETSNLEKNTKILHELMIFILFNLDVLTNTTIRNALKKQIVLLEEESVYIKNTETNSEFNSTLTELITIL